jgi:nucleoside-diphosphate-sugar epimerase
MRVLVAGDTGVIGRRLVPLLASAGHEVTGISRSPRPASGAASGIRHLSVDALDREAVVAAVRRVRPEAIVHVLTAIPAALDPKRLARDFAATNRLRTEGTRTLLAAAEETGVSRVIAQSVAFGYDPGGEGLADEDAPLWRTPPAQFVPVLAALRELERLTTGAGGLVLRFGHLYGPGSGYAADGSFVAQVRAGKVPLVGGGTATFSFTHAHDAAAAIVAALDTDVTGVLNVVDDDPAAVHTWLPHLAHLLSAPEPARVPKALARLAAGSWGVAFMTRLRGADNARARQRLDWRPRFGSWREGFAAELVGAGAGLTG